MDSKKRILGALIKDAHLGALLNDDDSRNISGGIRLFNKWNTDNFIGGTFGFCIFSVALAVGIGTLGIHIYKERGASASDSNRLPEKTSRDSNTSLENLGSDLIKHHIPTTTSGGYIQENGSPKSNESGYEGQSSPNMDIKRKANSCCIGGGKPLKETLISNNEVESKALGGPTKVMGVISHDQSFTANKPIFNVSSPVYRELQRESNTEKWTLINEERNLYRYNPPNPGLYSATGDINPSVCEFIEAKAKKNTYMVPHLLPGNIYEFSKIKGDEIIYKVDGRLADEKYQCSLKLHYLNQWIKGEISTSELELTYKPIGIPGIFNTTHPSHFIFKGHAFGTYSTTLPSNPDYVFKEFYNKNSIIYKHKASEKEMIVSPQELDKWRQGALVSSLKVYEVLPGFIKPTMQKEIDLDSSSDSDSGSNTPTSSASAFYDALQRDREAGIWKKLPHSDEWYFEPKDNDKTKDWINSYSYSCIEAVDQATSNTYMVPLRCPTSGAMFSRIEGNKAIYAKRKPNGETTEQKLLLSQLNRFIKRDIPADELA